MYTFFQYEDGLSFLVLGVVIISLFFILAGQVLAVSFNRKQIKLDTDTKLTFFMFFFLFLFILSYMYLIFDYGGLPIYRFLLEEVHPNVLRSDFYKNKEGIVNVFVYIRSILTKGFIPVCVVFLFFTGRKKNSQVFPVFLFST
jgi:hypothetical protein